MTKLDWSCLLVSVVTLSCCLISTNYLVEKMLKIPFQNSLNQSGQKFASPASIIFLTSGLIWICGTIYKCCQSLRNCSQEDQSIYDVIMEEEMLLDLHFDRINSSSSNLQKKGIAITQKQFGKKSKTISKVHNTSVSNHPPFIQLSKLLLSTFFQLLLFVYGIQYLSFPKVMIFKIISRLGLSPLYQSLFTEEPNKVNKFIISILAFLGFGLFNFFFLDNPEIEKDQKMYKDNIMLGYMFIVGMCYIGLVKKEFQKELRQKYGVYNNSGEAMFMQAKTNCILSYLLTLYFKQEIYGAVFTVLHYEFLLSVLGLTLSIFVGMWFKIHIINSYASGLGNFVGILQKSTSLILSVIVFGQGTNSGQIFGICIIALVAFFQFLQELTISLKKKENSIENAFYLNSQPSDHLVLEKGENKTGQSFKI